MKKKAANFKIETTEISITLPSFHQSTTLTPRYRVGKLRSFFFFVLFLFLFLFCGKVLTL